MVPGLDPFQPVLRERMDYRDVLVTPFTDLLDGSNGGLEHRGGPAWPDWAAETPARHFRGGVAIDVEPVPRDPDGTIATPLAWGGPIDRHFGHQIVSFSMRLASTLAAWPDATVAFAAHPRWGWSSIDDVPPFAAAILDWFGLASERRRLLVEPARVRHLAVWPQAEQQHGHGPSEAHLDLMDQLVAERLPTRRPHGVLYVSRAQMHARFAGEAYVETAMAAAGARVIRPEDHPLRVQLAAYADAETVIFAEGSAISSTRLLGRQLGDVIVIVRRPGYRIAEAALVPRCRTLSYRSALAGVVCGLNHAAEPFETLGIPVLDPRSMREALRDVLPSLARTWDDAAFIVARDQDVLEWLDRSLASPRVAGEASWAFMVERLREVGLDYLVADARSRMAARRANAGGEAGTASTT